MARDGAVVEDDADLGGGVGVGVAKEVRSSSPSSITRRWPAVVPAQAKAWLPVTAALASIGTQLDLVAGRGAGAGEVGDGVRRGRGSGVGGGR